MSTDGLGRREFLAATTAAGLSLTIGARAQENPAGGDLNVAFIGVGSQGRILMTSACNIPGLRFKAVCDIWTYSQKYAKGRLRAKGHDVNVYEDYRDMLANEPDLDAVIIATPDFMHAEHTIACLEAGLHVYCEKEMSNSLEKARHMVEAKQRTGKLLQIGHQRRSNPRYIHAIDRLLLKDHLAGRVTHANAQWNRAKSEDEGWSPRTEIPVETLAKYGYESMHQFRNWRWYKKYSGGPVVDLGSHQIDIFSWVFQNNPKSVIASGGRDFYTSHEWYDNVMAIFEYDSPEGTARAFYQVLTTTSCGGFYEQFMGVDATLVISEVPSRGNHFLKEKHVEQSEKQALWDRLAQEGHIIPPAPEVTEDKQTDDIYVDTRVSKELGAWTLPIELLKPAHQPHLENFFNAIRYGTELTCPAEIGYETAVAVLRVNEAVEANTRLEYNPEEFTV